MPVPTEYTLTDAERQLFLDYNTQVADLNNQAAGGLRMILRQHNLVGPWELSGDFTRLVLPVPQVPQAPPEG